MPPPPPSPPADPAEEPVDLIDEDDRVIGWARRREVRARNLLHRGVGIICYNPRGEIYVHQRTAEKDVFPGLFDMLVGGVVGRGESYAGAAAREVREELGIEGPVPEFLCRYLYQGPHNRSLVAVYRVVWDGPIRHQASEVAWGAYASREELEALIESREFVPDGLEIYRHLERHALLG